MRELSSEHAADDAESDENRNETPVHAESELRQHHVILRVSRERLERNHDETGADRLVHRQPTEKRQRRNDQKPSADPHQSGQYADEEPVRRDFPIGTWRARAVRLRRLKHEKTPRRA